jgi:hypothetical protein
MYWKNFFDEIRSRLVSPFKYPQYIGYFIFCILIIGAMGVNIRVWDYFFNNGSSVSIAREMATYLIAILGSSILDLNLSQKIRNKDSFLIYSLILLLFGVFIVFLIAKLDNNISIIIALLGVFISWFVWWFANSDNLLLTREPAKSTLDEVTGGNPSNNLTGTIAEFKS